MNPLDAWIDELARELAVDPAAVDRQLLLDVARDAARGVARPAAPLTTYLVGLAAGLHGGSAAAAAAAAATAQRLAIARTGRVSARLSLHAVDVAEAERIRAGRPASTDRWAAGYPFEGDRKAVEAFLSASAAHGGQGAFGYYRIERLDDGLTVGGIGFRGRPDERGTVEVGFGLIPAARGQGYAREALDSLLGVARENAVRAVRADTAVDNVASQRTLLGAGFVEEDADAELRHFRMELAGSQGITRSAPA